MGHWRTQTARLVALMTSTMYIKLIDKTLVDRTRCQSLAKLFGDEIKTVDL